MDTDEERIQYAIEHTEVLRPPKGSLATFGTTNIRYYLVTEPLYRELVDSGDETVVREGRVIAERPRIVTPFYLANLFRGFEHGREYGRQLLQAYGPHEPGLMYRYENELRELSIVSEPLVAVAHKLGDRIDREGDPLTTIIKGIDAMWDVSLMKFIHELTRSSLGSNIMELRGRGLFEIDRGGVPKDARIRIEELFKRVGRGEIEPFELKAELDRWALFPEYEDRFLAIFKNR